MSDIVSRPLSKEGEETWDRVFGKKKKHCIYVTGINSGNIKHHCTCAGEVIYDAYLHRYWCNDCGATS